MRISDWSSDVCSSDLFSRATGSEVVDHVLDREGERLRPVRPLVAAGARDVGAEADPDQILEGREHELRRAATEPILKRGRTVCRAGRRLPAEGRTPTSEQPRLGEGR